LTAAARQDLPPAHALLLGAIQGPAEVLPVSSSAHLILVPALLGWPYSRVDPPLRKAFEVAVHGGAGAALAILLRDELRAILTSLHSRRAGWLALACGPAAVAGAALRTPIESRLSEPRVVALAQVAAGLALGLSDLRPTDRGAAQATGADAAAVGLAQALALVPGVSRGGAALTALRLRRLERRVASRLAREAGLPLLLAAAGAEASGIGRDRPARALAVPLIAGAAAAAAATLASRRLLAALDRSRSLAPLAAYRVLLGLAAYRRLRRRPPARSGSITR
jgi:undecaprenyl-diphosphatase